MIFFTGKYNRLIVVSFFLASLVSIYLAMYGWHGAINEYYGFRQAQTAISAFYMVKDGIVLNYVTPVLGPPWSIPFEFPSYQIAVATLVNITDLPLDQAGRWVSVISFYLCIVPVYSLSRLAGVEKGKVLLVLVFFISSPLYIFWSRTFMIESTALLFSLLLINMGCYYLWTKKLQYVLWAFLFGLLSALTKVTTFVVASTLLTGIIFYIWMLRSDRFSIDVAKKYVMLGLISMGVPLLVSVYWTMHADSVKALNPLADFILSKNLSQWNFGTFDQRFSPAIWDHLLWRVSSAFGYTWNFNTLGLRLSLNDWSLLRTVLFVLSQASFVWIFCTLLCSKKYRVLGAGLLLVFLSGPLLFINLYFEHEYYFYANAIYLLVALGFGLVAVYERQPALSLVLLLILVVARVDAYKAHYISFIDHSSNYNDQALYQAIKEKIKEDEVFIGIGDTWSSEIPYYSERKAIMINVEQIDYDSFESSINLLGRDKVSAVVVCGDKSGINEQRLIDVVGDFSLKARPVFENTHCGLYLRENNVTIIMSQLMAASDAPSSHVRKLSPDRLFSHAPSKTDLALSNVKSILVGYGLQEGSGDKTEGVCFEVSLEQEGIKTSLARDCIHRSESSTEILRHFEIELDSLSSGRLVLENSCINNHCDWAWSYWDNVLWY